MAFRLRRDAGDEPADLREVDAGAGATFALRRGADGVWRGVRDTVLDG